MTNILLGEGISPTEIINNFKYISKLQNIPQINLEAFIKEIWTPIIKQLQETINKYIT